MDLLISSLITAATAIAKDGFNLNVVELALDKPLDQSQWASGYHVELLFGPDADGISNSTA